MKLPAMTCFALGVHAVWGDACWRFSGVSSGHTQAWLHACEVGQPWQASKASGQIASLCAHLLMNTYALALQTEQISSTLHT